MRKVTKIKKIVVMLLLPVPVITYVAAILLKAQKPQYIGFAALFIVVLIIILIKTNIIFVNEASKRKIHFSLIKEQNGHHEK